MSFKTILVASASRGIGLVVAKHFVSQCDRLEITTHGNSDRL
ncbi:hypothetical protein [Tumidithrix helvetica]